MSVENSSFFKQLQAADIIEPTAITTLVADAGAEWYMEDAAASSLEESKKSVLARFVLEYMDQGIPSDKPGVPPKPMSFVQAEQRGLADPRFEAHIEMMVSSRRRANLARVRYDMGKVFLELQRSAQSTRRQEMVMNGVGHTGQHRNQSGN